MYLFIVHPLFWHLRENTNLSFSYENLLRKVRSFSVSLLTFRIFLQFSSNLTALPSSFQNREIFGKIWKTESNWEICWNARPTKVHIFLSLNPYQLSVAFHIKNSNLFCYAKNSYMKRSTGLKLIKKVQK